MFQETQDINCAFVFYLLQHTVYHNVGTSSANTSTTENIRETHEIHQMKANAEVARTELSKNSHIPVHGLPFST